MKKWHYLAVCLLSVTAFGSGCQKQGDDRYTSRQFGIEALSANDPEEAIRYLDQALDKSRGKVGKFELDVLKYRAEAEYRLGQYETAADTISDLITADKERPEYLYLRAAALAKKGDSQTALDDYEKAAAGEPGSSLREEALLAVGEALETGGETPLAMELYEKAQGEGLKGPRVYNSMGLNRMKDKAYEEAKKLFDQGIQADSGKKVPELHFNKAVACEYQGDFAQALALMEQYVANFGSNEQAEREIAFLKTR